MSPTQSMSNQAKLFIVITAVIGAVFFRAGFIHPAWSGSPRFLCYLALALLASGLKVNLPGVTGSMSVNFLFILIGTLELTYTETLLIGCLASMVQTTWKIRASVRPVHLIFNFFQLSTAIGLSFWVYHHTAGAFHGVVPFMLAATAVTYFLANTIPVAAIVCLTEGGKLTRMWANTYFWSFPYYLVGACIAGLVGYLNQLFGWETSVLALPVVYWIYRSYRLYLSRLEDEKRSVENEKRHVEEMASLHMRTIEALALAIEAKDHTTHDHLQRVRVYACEVGKELGLAEQELEALRAASLLHDIGKLAVPEHIINKPGKLTPEEFEKMKIHPIVGAEILERVNFPYPVVPIVRSHHERWDGSGYPYGLQREEIPIGARILSAVDCLDALATDRQYRRALPLEEAMQEVTKLAGKHFDPAVIEVLGRRYVELEAMAKHRDTNGLKQLSRSHGIVKGVTPATGFENVRDMPKIEFVNSIVAARYEAQTLFELSHDLGKSLSLDETLSVLSLRLGKLIPFDSIVIYLLQEDRLVPGHVSGENFRLFSSLEIPLGQGLSGWVAQNHLPIVNGNPAVEPGYLDDPTKFSTLLSALSVPLEASSQVVGVISLYKSQKDAFSNDHLRIVLSIASKIAASIENALKYQQATNLGRIDYLTGLPNARALFLQLDRELARCKRENTPLAVFMCDLDGFKQINDRYGHIEGNRVLQLFAKSLRSACREYDYVARMGGDEFVVLAPGLTRDHVDDKAGYFGMLAIQAGREVCGEDLLGVSVGAAFYGENGLDAEQLLAEADRHMYAVKELHHRKRRPEAAFLGATPAVYSKAIN